MNSALNFTPLQFGGLMIGYALVLTLIIRAFGQGFTSRKVSYLLANRHVNTLVAAVSVASAWAWAPAFFVSSQMTYLNGWVGLFWFTFMNAGSFIVFAFFADKFRKLVPRGYTLTSYMRERFSSRVQVLYLIAHVTLAASALAVQLLAGGAVISKLTGLPFLTVTVVFALVPIGYTLYAGLFASVVSDAVKMTLFVVIAAIVLPWTVLNAGGFEVVLAGIHGIKATPANGPLEEFFTGNGFAVMLGFGIPASLGWIAGQFGDPYYWQQGQAVRERSVFWMFMLAAPIFAIIPISLSLLGFVGAGLGLQVENSQLVNVEVVGRFVPTWAGILFVLLLITGMISALDCHLSAISALAGHDLFNRVIRGSKVELTSAAIDKGSVRYSRISMIVLTIFGVAIANGTVYLLRESPGTMIVWLFLCYGTLRAATFLPTVVALNRPSVSESGMFWGIMVSLVVGLPLFFWGNLYNVTEIKIVGSLVTMFASGTIVFLASRRIPAPVCA